MNEQVVLFNYWYLLLNRKRPQIAPQRCAATKMGKRRICRLGKERKTSLSLLRLPQEKRVLLYWVVSSKQTPK